jgi:hypothetical protein
VTITADNHFPVEANATIEVVKVSVLGAELAGTGFSVKEFLILVSIFIVLIISGNLIKRKNLI